MPDSRETGRADGLRRADAEGVRPVALDALAASLLGLSVPICRVG